MHCCCVDCKNKVEITPKKLLHNLYILGVCRRIKKSRTNDESDGQDTESPAILAQQRLTENPNILRNPNSYELLNLHTEFDAFTPAEPANTKSLL